MKTFIKTIYNYRLNIMFIVVLPIVIYFNSNVSIANQLFTLIASVFWLIIVYLTIRRYEI